MSQSTASAPPKAMIPDGPLDVFKFRWLFIGISLLFLVPGIYFIFSNLGDPGIGAPVRLGIDFKGGTMLEYGFSRPVAQADIADIHTVFDERGYTGSIIQIEQPRVGINQKAVEVGAASSGEKAPPSASEPASPEAAKALSAESAAEKPAPPVTRAPLQGPQAVREETAPQAAGDKAVASIVSIRSKQLQGQDELLIRKTLSQKYGKVTVLQKNTIGPALARELFQNGLLALVLAYILIVGYLTIRFQFDFAICAMVALVHDTVFLLGMFAMFGKLFNTEVDSLFVTAILTVVGFSVHDTIVVFDRIRENNRLYFTKKVPFVNIVNMSVNQTMARSINTSLTALLTMLALYFFGGETTKDFVLAIIIGIAAGTYSSIFNASVLLAMWRNRNAPAPKSKGVPAAA